MYTDDDDVCMSPALPYVCTSNWNLSRCLLASNKRKQFFRAGVNMITLLPLNSWGGEGRGGEESGEEGRGGKGRGEEGGEGSGEEGEGEGRNVQ